MSKLIQAEIKAIEGIFCEINKIHGKYASIVKDGSIYSLRAGYVLELTDGIELKPYHRIGEFNFNIENVSIEALRNAKKNFKKILNHEN
jgi:hypothetical protein